MLVLEKGNHILETCSEKKILHILDTCFLRHVFISKEHVFQETRVSEKRNTPYFNHMFNKGIVHNLHGGVKSTWRRVYIG